MRWLLARCALQLSALVLAAPSAHTPATTPVACATNRLCSCQPGEMVCIGVPLHRLPEWPNQMLRHVDISMASLDILAENALDGLRLQSLLLIGNKLGQIESKALFSMVNTLSSLDLSYNKFTEIPLKALRELRALNWLNLQNNAIHNVNRSHDWGHVEDSLTSLSLANNDINRITDFAFHKLTRLLQLDLEGNKIQSISASYLPKSLLNLKLSNNLVSLISCDMLRSLPRLRSLHYRNNFLDNIQQSNCKWNESRKIDTFDLSNNYIININRSLLSNFLHIRHIILDFNLLSSLSERVVKDTKLVKLSLSFNKLVNFEAGFFVSLKDTLEQLEVDHNKLTSLPKSLRHASRLEHLSLSYNLFMEAPTLPPRLKSLSMAGNYITTIPAEELREIDSDTLRYLDLSYNFISHLLSSQFDTWSGALVNLNLKGNRISQLDSNSFPASMPVKELILSFNDLYYVHPSTFANVSSTVQIIELSSTLFSSESVEFLSNLDNLLSVTLDDNNIHIISSTDIEAFSSIDHIVLDFNEIVDINFDSNMSLYIRDLRLSFNFIEHLRQDVFRHFILLESLDLSYNRIQNISTKSLYKLPNLLYLSLSGNQIKTTDDLSFFDLPNLATLELQENNLTEFSLFALHNVSTEQSEFTLNLSRNFIHDLYGSKSTVSVTVFDCSYNNLKEIPKAFILSLKHTVRQIILSHNDITSIQSQSFETLIKLSLLNLHANKISVIKRRAFSDLTSLQILDLSHNYITQLAIEQFSNLKSLRFLKLNKNEIKTLPRDVFKNTILEHIDLNSNDIVIYPSTALSQVGFTLRYLDLGDNTIEYLDSHMFQSTLFLLELNLSRNKLTVLSDNTFVSLSKLSKLDLSFNSIKANFKELFHYLSNLKHLRLANIGLNTVPYLPLLNLTTLNLTSNNISRYNEDAVRNLINLQELYLSNNQFSDIVPNIWSNTPYLKVLDLSLNPITKISSRSFYNLSLLLHLRLNWLNNLERIDEGAFRPLTSLHTLHLQTWSRVNKQTFRVKQVTGELKSLHKLVLHVTDPVLSDQLHGAFNHKLKQLEIWGSNLKEINDSAFKTCENLSELYLKISKTSIGDLPQTLMDHLGKIPYLGLDLSNNQLTSLSPAVFYPNISTWNQVATKLLSGGLIVNGNPLRCGCSLSWLGGWMRRWLQESAQMAHAAAPRALRDALRMAVCHEDQRKIPLLQLRPDDQCRARALASSAVVSSYISILILNLTFLLIYLNS